MSLHLKLDELRNVEPIWQRGELRPIFFYKTTAFCNYDLEILQMFSKTKVFIKHMLPWNFRTGD
jgi:hypothetical protein